MGLPRYDSGLCYDAADAPDRERLAGPAPPGDQPPASWSNPTTNEPWNPADRGPTVDTWKDTNGYGGGAVTGVKVSGTGDTISKDTPAAGTATLDDAAGAFIEAMEEHYITISGATAVGNNGLFKVTQVNGPTQLEYHNPDAQNVTEPFSYAVAQADQGYGTDPVPTQSWRFDVDLPEGWYTRSSTKKKYSGQQ